MSDPQNSPPFEEPAALQALDLLDETSRQELLRAAERSPEIDARVRDFAETAALLAHEVPQVNPPPGLRQEILRRLPIHGATSKVIPFSQWIAYAIAACLMVLGISQARQILGLKAQLLATRADASRLEQSNALMGLHLATLTAQNGSYASSKIIVAWDPYQHRGVLSLQNLPAPPADHDYQLWVLDPAAEAPRNAGLITGSRTFTVNPVLCPSPGFAISLEPSGGRPEPTGPILFAVAPGA